MSRSSLKMTAMDSDMAALTTLESAYELRKWPIPSHRHRVDSQKLGSRRIGGIAVSGVTEV